MTPARSVAPLVASALLAAGCGDTGAPPRTVSGAFTTVFRPEGAPETTLATPPPDGFAATALLFPDAGGYRAFPLQLDAGQAFSISGVPSGSWFLALERSRDVLRYVPETDEYLVVPVKELALHELSSDRPDLSVVSAARPDLVRQSMSGTSVALSLSGLDPWESSSRLFILCAPADFGLFLAFLPAPAPVDGGWSGTYPWAGVGSGLPAPGDDVYAFQRTASRVGTGSDLSTASVVTRAAWSNDLAFADGETNAADLVFQDASLQAVSFDVRTTAFSAFAGQVWPGQALASGFATASLTPGPTAFPDQRTSRAEVNVAVLSITDTSADHQYDLTYRAPLPVSWQRFRRSGFAVGPLLEGFLGFAELSSVEPYSGLTRPVAPVLGPPTAPKIDGRDLATPQAGVGTAPVLSWSPPTAGAPTHYEVAVSRIDTPEIAGEPYALTATLRGTSFRLPAGFLMNGYAYRAKVTAVEAPGAGGDAPFRKGMPRHVADRVTATFAP